MRRTGTPPGPTPKAVLSQLSIAGLRNIATRDVYYFEDLPAQTTGSRRFTIGRDDTCDITLQDACVSAVHCVVEHLDNGTYVLHDNDSTNGTFLLMAGIPHRVTTRMISFGARIWLGETLLATINEKGKVLLSASTETEFRREAYRVYGTTCEAGDAIGKSPETIRRALRKAQRKHAQRHTGG